MTQGETLSELPRIVGSDREWPWSNECIPLVEPRPRGRPWPRISIVTPSFNQARFLEETLRSVLLQGYPALEYIVVDGGSTDGSVEILRRYAPWLTWWVSEPDAGQVEAIHKGFSHASGEVRGFLNSDDLLLPGALVTIGEEFAAHGQRRPLLVSFGGRLLEGGRFGAPFPPPRKPRLSEWLVSPTSLFQPGTLWNRALWAQLGGFREDLDFAFDKEFFLRATFRLRAYRPGPPRAVAAFRIHADAKSARLQHVRDAETSRIRAELADSAWARRTIAREHREALGRTRLADSFRQTRSGSRLWKLVHAAIAWPGLLGERIFWGALRRSFPIRTR